MVTTNNDTPKIRPKDWLLQLSLISEYVGTMTATSRALLQLH